MCKKMISCCVVKHVAWILISFKANMCRLSTL